MAALLLVTTVAVVVVVALSRDSLGERPSVEVPTWQAVVGFGIAGAGLLLHLSGVVATVRSSRRLRTWSSPLAVLTRSQRKELLAHVRGGVLRAVRRSGTHESPRPVLATLGGGRDRPGRGTARHPPAR